MAAPYPQPQQNQLNELTEEFQEISNLEKKLAGAEAPEELKEKAFTMIERLRKVIKYVGYSKEFEPVAKYIDWIVSVPWGTYTKDNLDIQEVKKKLDEHHYGLDATKGRILEYLAVLKLNNMQLRKQMEAENPDASASAEMSALRGSSANAPILCFVGIQGIGKTSLAKSIANALGRKFYRISLGGMGNSNALRGIGRGIADAEPGQIIKGLVRTQTMNPLILLDELDKVSEKGGTRADIMAALLEILDPEQNVTFVDHYMDYPVNLSRVMFITTANNLGGISAALLDRLEIIRFSSYTDDDKINIARNYLLPKVRKATGLSEDQLTIREDVWPMVVRPLGFDAGIRELERTITRVCRKVAMMIVQGQVDRVELTPENFRQFIPDDFGILS